MNYTVLGSGGFIGSRLVQRIRNSGEDVYAPIRGDEEIFDRDLGLVVYAIGLTADFRQRPYDTAEAHICYLSKILQKAQFSSLTYLSSTRVYNGAETGQETETLKVIPTADGLYNLTKLTGEALCLQSGCGKVARLSNIVGDGASESFVSELISEAETGSVKLRSAVTSAKDYLLVDDAISALLAIVLCGEVRIYNVASGKNISTAEILDALSMRFKFKVDIAEHDTEFTFPVIDVMNIRKLLTWEPQLVTTWIKETQLINRSIR